MRLVVFITVGLGLWIVLWALGTKSFDAFMLTILIVIIGVTVEMVSRKLPGRASRDSDR